MKNAARPRPPKDVDRITTGPSVTAFGPGLSRLPALPSAGMRIQAPPPHARGARASALLAAAPTDPRSAPGWAKLDARTHALLLTMPRTPALNQLIGSRAMQDGTALERAQIIRIFRASLGLAQEIGNGPIDRLRTVNMGRRTVLDELDQLAARKPEMVAATVREIAAPTDPVARDRPAEYVRQVIERVVSG